MGFISFLLLGLCGVCSHVVCDVVWVPYVVDAVAMMCVLFFVSMLREYGHAGVGDGEV